jgi:nitroreductase
MFKNALTKFSIHPLLNKRWSPRAFSNIRVTDDELGSLFEAARWAPSAFNRQPWSFIVATKKQPQEFQQLTSCVSGGNQLWAKNATALVLATSQHRKEDGAVNSWAEYDLGGAVAQLTLQAGELGLHVHQMAGFDPAKAIELYKIPTDWRPMTVLAIGRLGDVKELSVELQVREKAKRRRKSFAEFIFQKRWGRPAELNNEKIVLSDKIFTPAELN